ncbi:hypothetical protein L227DRAFT_578923 [Lentinus tigrinus ALCF2SS1-6]|uniref:Uncharacterized protein n=1 Tax=Lentinus tigrinus ALCF2SS1-6 TaxID=1328759 RepID=A0A5C2RZG5_9APHY|nr:hypothetical protein L227DRAFT_578923 [Lentinus tigrinus ALCF2SS1-6]
MTMPVPSLPGQVTPSRVVFRPRTPSREQRASRECCSHQPRGREAGSETLAHGPQVQVADSGLASRSRSARTPSFEARLLRPNP